MIETLHHSVSSAEDSRPSQAWRLETRLVRVRWVAVPACFGTLLLSPSVSLPLVAGGATLLALGNLVIAQRLRQHRDPSHPGPIAALATGLEWLVGSVLIGGCSPDLVRCTPAVLITLLAFVLLAILRDGRGGFLGALGGDIALLAVVKLAFHPAVAWLALATWAIILVAASAILGSLLLWLRQDLHRAEREQRVLRQRLRIDEQRLGAERALLERLRAEEQQWEADHAALQLLRSGLTRRERELLPLLARPDLSCEEIAALLSVSAETIRTHLHHIGEKLGVFPRERRMIVTVARERGLLPPGGPDRPGGGGGVEKRSPGG